MSTVGKVMSEQEPAGPDGISLESISENWKEIQKRYTKQMGTGVGNIRQSLNELKDDESATKRIIDYKNHEDQSSPLEQGIDQKEWAKALREISLNDTALKQILKVRDGLLGEDGRMLRNLMREMLEDPGKRKTFVQAVEYKECEKAQSSSLQALINCRPPLSENFKFAYSLYRFSETGLMKNIELLLATLESPKSDFKWLQEGNWEPLFGLILALEPHVFRMVDTLTRDLNAAELKEVLSYAAKLFDSPNNKQLAKIKGALSPEAKELFEAGFLEFTGFDWPTLTAAQLRKIIGQLGEFIDRYESEIDKLFGLMKVN